VSKYYYEAIQVNVNKTGSYTLGSNSIVYTYGYLYKDNFNPFQPSENLISENNNIGGGGQFKFTIDLQASTTYILVVTTFDPNVQGKFSIFVSDPSKVTLNCFREYRYCSVNNQHGSIKSIKYL
jgi:hypothetical protein